MPQVTIQQAFDLALQLHRDGKLQEAQQLYNDLGLTLFGAGQFDQAIAAYERAIAVNPQYVEALINLGNVFAATGRHDQALAMYRQVMALSPTNAQAHNNSGNVLKEKGQLEQAIAAFRQALTLSPAWAAAWFNLGNTIKETGHLDEAVAAFRQCIALDPNLPPAYTGLGRALKAQGQLEEAIVEYRKAISIKPDYAVGYHDLGITLQDVGKIDDAIAAYQRAIELNTTWADAHHDLAQALLYRGDFLQGWAENEWRWQIKGAPPARLYPGELLKDQDLKGKTILLYAEQGFGDAIQFIRYAPKLVNLGATIIVEVPSQLKRIFESAAGVNQVVEQGQPLPEIDFYCPLLSLPLGFKTTLQSIPARVPYLFPDAQVIEKWREKLNSTNIKVGLAWGGSIRFKADRTRSISLDRLAPLVNIPHVTFFSIQKGEPASQADHPPAGLSLINLSPEIDDFADTAAVMSMVDLVITTDTSVAHLAGALGRPVWVMLQYVPDWRWLSDRHDSPWYPTMRLFRQSSPGDWDGVISRVAEALAGFSNSV